ncbi:exopolysaccharide phosphotransferase CpsY [Kocuria flava]|uniref:Exopolysaccharide phosphotransferase CpsY n=2 Tax=Kocuria flava TaxID=446860 RepID=A0ABQ0X5T9_9MICC|nr:exopolysaccharide phosphotransferase CpsY [Kocuria flava]
MVLRALPAPGLTAGAGEVLSWERRSRGTDHEETTIDTTVLDTAYFPAPEDGTDGDEFRSASRASAAALEQREDVVRYKGRFALRITDRTPYEVMVENLLFLRGVLDAAGIDHLLVRGNDERPVVAVDLRERTRLREALVAAAEGEPYYVKPMDTKKKTSELLADGELSHRRNARVFRLYRPHYAKRSRLYYGAATGVQIELWEFGRDEIRLPVENSLTRRSVSRAEAVRGTVERFGLQWATIENMFADHASDIDFEIDMVFSWVDGSDPEYRRVRASYMEDAVVGEGDDHEARFRQVDELKYALRSVHMFAPWVRTIWIATDSAPPAWLAEHPRVRIVRSEEFFEDTSVLPIYNSQAVEAQLHRIEGLAEHFLYSNDDMFFGRQIGPSLFFSPGGVTKFVEASTRIGLGEGHPERSGFENAARVNRKLLWERFGRITTRHLEHCAAPLRRSVVTELEQEFPEEFRRTAASRFRAAGNISVTNSLYHYYALLAGRAVTQDTARTAYVDTTTEAGLQRMERLLAKRGLDMFCLNDGSFPEVPAAERAERMREFLERYFPVPAPWEK